MAPMTVKIGCTPVGLVMAHSPSAHGIQVQLGNCTGTPMGIETLTRT